MDELLVATAATVRQQDLPPTSLFYGILTFNIFQFELRKNYNLISLLFLFLDYKRLYNCYHQGWIMDSKIELPLEVVDRDFVNALRTRLEAAIPVGKNFKEDVSFQLCRRCCYLALSILIGSSKCF